MLFHSHQSSSYQYIFATSLALSLGEHPVINITINNVKSKVMLLIMFIIQSPIIKFLLIIF